MEGGADAESRAGAGSCGDDGGLLAQLAELGAQPAVDTLQSGELLILRSIPASPEGSPGELHFFQNVGGLGCPQVRLGFLIVPVNIVMDRLLQFAHIVKNATPKALVGQSAEEPLHHVEPGRAGGGEVNVKA